MLIKFDQDAEAPPVRTLSASRFIERSRLRPKLASAAPRAALIGGSRLYSRWCLGRSGSLEAPSSARAARMAIGGNSYYGSALLPILPRRGFYLARITAENQGNSLYLTFCLL